jgi:hypothetical protein
MIRAIWAVLLLSSVAVMYAQETRGIVTVAVIDQTGAPVQSASVKLDPSPTPGISHVSPMCKTDSTGSCTRYGLAMGTYLLGAMKPSAGYPDLTFDFYSHETKRIQVVLTPASPQKNIVFRLGPPMAILKLSFIDDGSGVPLNSPSITLRGGSGANDWISIGRNADSTVLVPPDRDIRLEVNADGYEPWQLQDHTEISPGGVLHLHSGDKQEMIVRMKRQ